MTVEIPKSHSELILAKEDADRKILNDLVRTFIHPYAILAY